MATYPGGIYTRADVPSGTTLGSAVPSHRVRENELKNEVIAEQTELGIDPHIIDATVAVTATPTTVKQKTDVLARRIADIIGSFTGAVSLNQAALVTKFDAATGHAHSGSAGDGGQVSHASLAALTTGNPHTQYAQKSGDTFTGEVVATDFKPSGLTGATQAVRIVGGTTSGAPASGTFAVGDGVIARNGHFWICTVAGTPGTWVDAGTYGAGGGGGGGGSTITAGPLASRPAGASGDVYFATDAPYVSEKGASAWAAFGPVFPMGEVPTFTDPASTGGGEDASHGGLRIFAAANNAILRMRGKAAPATPYTIKALLHIDALIGGDGDRIGLYWRDSSGGHIVRCCIEYISGLLRFNTYENSDPSTFVGTLGSSLQLPACKYSPWVCMGLSDDGTNKSFLAYPDGFNPATVYTTTHAGVITPNQVGAFAQAPNATGDVYGWLVSWLES